jgi:hypothetical protein
MSGKSVRAVIAALLLALVIALNVQSATKTNPLHSQEPTPAVLVEEHSTTGS